MLKYNILKTNSNKNILLNLNNNIDFIKEYDFINENDFVTEDFLDSEINKYTLNSDVKYTFRFFNGLYQNSFLAAGFTEEEINLSNKSYRYSYILIQIYDSIDSKNQTLLSTSYLPLYFFPDRTLINDKTISEYNTDIENNYKEFYNLYISNINQLDNIDMLYAKFSFFNAKTGKLILFYNQTITNNTEEKIYFKILLNKENKFYSFINPNIIAYQFLNEEFINRINERDKQENKSPIFPTGDLFNINGTYI